MKHKVRAFKKQLLGFVYFLLLAPGIGSFRLPISCVFLDACFLVPFSVLRL